MANIRAIDTFGSVAAEEDPILEYFLETESVRAISEHRVFLVLGRKGSGKTAIVRYFAEGKQLKSVSKAVTLRGYPWGLHAKRIDAGASDVDAYVASWRYLIAVQLTALLLKNIPVFTSHDVKSLQQFLKDNYGTSDPELRHVLTPGKLKIAKGTIEPSFLGAKLFTVNLERNGATDFGSHLDALTEAMLGAVGRVAADFKVRQLFLHFDELDQGLAKLDDSRAQMLIGLVLAARGVRSFFANDSLNVSPIVYLRTDLWRALNFSDKNKISRSASFTLEWDARSLKDMVEYRLKAKLGRATKFEDVEDREQMRGSQQKFNHVLARTFLRPRDVIQFLNLGLGEAKRRDDNPLVLTNKDIIEARVQYSNYLRDELDDEIKSIWPDWERAVRALAGIATVTFERNQFREEYAKYREDDEIDADAALQILFDFSVIGYETRSGYGGSSWAFQYTHPETGWDPSAQRFKVHAGLKEYAKLKEERY